MRVIVERDREGVSRRAALVVATLVRRRPTCVLGLATGSTPLGMYAELIRLHREEGLDFSRVVTFNLDEYVGLSGSHPQSYRYFMQQNLFDHINIDPRDTHVPDGRALDFEAYCEQYERMIAEEGGIDLQVLGIGSDGHIAFNEPGSSLGSRTRLKTLTEETVRDNARFFGSEKEVPRLAITMGVGTILESRQCLLLAAGDSKAQGDPRHDRGPDHRAGHRLGPAVAPRRDRDSRRRSGAALGAARLLSRGRTGPGRVASRPVRPLRHADLFERFLCTLRGRLHSSVRSRGATGASAGFASSPGGFSSASAGSTFGFSSAVAAGSSFAGSLAGSVAGGAGNCS